MKAEQRDIPLQQRFDTRALHANDARILVFPKIAVVHQNRIRALRNRLLDQRQARGHAGDDFIHLGPALDLQAVRAVVAVACGVEQRAGIMLQLG